MQHNQQNPIKLLIVDDHELVRDGIRARLEDETHIEIIGEAANGLEAISKARELSPDLIMIDINMPHMNGLDAVAKIREQKLPCRVLLLSIYDNREYVSRAKSLGANGYILKDVSQPEMVRAIKMAAEGQFYVSENLASALTKPARVADDPYGLTTRERQVLLSIANGKLNKQIAAELDISVRTVESHRSAIRQKTGGGNAARLTHIASELKLENVE